MRSSIELFNELAAGYDQHFQVPHRRAYDDLAWELVEPLVPASPGVIVDAGCGTGRWAARLIALGHHVVGIEQAPRMAAVARGALPGHHFELHEIGMEDLQLPEAGADLVLALGSLQYTRDPERMVERFARWTRPGGWVIVLVDSLVALVLELLSVGKVAEAIERLTTRRGRWIYGQQVGEHHLFDRLRLEATFRHAGLENVHAHGLIVGATGLGRDRLNQALTDDWDVQLGVERVLARDPVLADTGKQILVAGQSRGSSMTGSARRTTRFRSSLV